jgi:hypothetical protein
MTDIKLTLERLKVKLNPKPKGESWAEHGYEGGLKHEKEHPQCVEAQKEREAASNESLDRRLHRIERKFGDSNSNQSPHN